MQPSRQPSTDSPANTANRTLWILLAACVLVSFVVALWPKAKKEVSHESTNSVSASGSRGAARSSDVGRTFAPRRQADLAPKLGAEEIVARKLSQFARGRRKIAHDFADHLKIPVPPEVDQLFDGS